MSHFHMCVSFFGNTRCDKMWFHSEVASELILFLIVFVADKDRSGGSSSQNLVVGGGTETSKEVAEVGDKVHIVGMHAHAASHSHSHPEGHHTCNNDANHEHMNGHVGHGHDSLATPDEGLARVRHVAIAQVRKKPDTHTYHQIHQHCGYSLMF